MRRTILLLIPILLCSAEGHFGQSRSQESLARELQELARIATVMVDGDVCQRIMTARALQKMFVIDPKDRFAGSDNFDVNHEPYIQTKKTLMRLASLLPYPIDCNLWMLFREDPKKIQILIRNKYEMSQLWSWGSLYQDQTPEMAEVLASGRPVTLSQKAGFVSVLTPVYNSLGEIVALVEVVSRVEVDLHENVK